MKFLKALFDSKDRSAEMHLFLAALAVLAVIILTAYAVLAGHIEALSTMGNNLGFPLGATGAAALGQGLQSKFTPPDGNP